MSLINIDDENIKTFVSEGELFDFEPELKRCHKILLEGTGAGSDFLGWLRLPSKTTESSLIRIESAAAKISEMADVFVCIGTGGSSLGARAGIEFFSHSGGPEIYFAGNEISSVFLKNILNLIGDRRICINVISKSGTTTETALAFRFLKKAVERRHGREEASDRIFVTTRPEGGALNDLASAEGYSRFLIPDDVGGRFSVLSPVGLLPMAVAGIDIRHILEGAQEVESAGQTNGLDNPIWRYAALRELLRRKGKTIEIMASFQPRMTYFLEWWKQLAGESEGKQGKGLFPASVQYTADLHSFGQWVQEGPRDLFETFLWIESSRNSLKVPRWKEDVDGLNYLEGRTLEEVNQKAYEGTARAHFEGGVPNLIIKLEQTGAQGLGALFYFFQRTVALTGYLLGVNPFDQPGVEIYKKNMFTLLNKPGYGKGV